MERDTFSDFGPLRGHENAPWWRCHVKQRMGVQVYNYSVSKWSILSILTPSFLSWLVSILSPPTHTESLSAVLIFFHLHLTSSNTQYSVFSFGVYFLSLSPLLTPRIKLYKRGHFSCFLHIWIFNTYVSSCHVVCIQLFMNRYLFYHSLLNRQFLRWDFAFVFSVLRTFSIP